MPQPNSSQTSPFMCSWLLPPLLVPNEKTENSFSRIHSKILHVRADETKLMMSSIYLVHKLDVAGLFFCSLSHIIGHTFSTVSYSPAMYCRPICVTSLSIALLTFDLYLCETHSKRDLVALLLARQRSNVAHLCIFCLRDPRETFCSVDKDVAYLLSQPDKDIEITAGSSQTTLIAQV